MEDGVSVDNSETYIRQCDCPEIQGLFTKNDRTNPRNHAYCPTHQTMAKDILGTYECVECPVPWVKGDSIDAWIILPHQDQLQEMVNWKAYELVFSWLAIHRLYYCKAGTRLLYFHTGKPEDMGGYLTGNSMEQLWLAFIMKEKYGKVWDGDKWIIN